MFDYMKKPYTAMLRRYYLQFSIIMLLIMFLYNCQSGSTTDDTPPKEEIIMENETKKDETAKLLKINDRLFSIPSPFQMSFLFKEEKIVFNSELLNPTDNTRNYNTIFKQSLNLGVYGANLGYLHIYEQYPEAARYFAVVKILAEDLGITNFIDQQKVERIEKNQNNKDSLMYITSTLFRDADAFLLNNEQNDKAVLILAGGWIEALYLLTQPPQAQNEAIINRIGEQKRPLDNLIEIMRPYYGKQRTHDFDQLLEELVELATVFDGVDIEYTYKKPVVNKHKKLSIIKSKSKVIISDYQLKTIIDKIASIRNKIIE